MESIFSIKKDSFIYAVQQTYEARSKPNGEFNSHLKYTPFLENSWQKPNEGNLSALKETLEDILNHHWGAIPHYQRHEKVNLENISWFSHSIAALIADINYLLKNVLGYDIPKKDEQTLELWSIITNAVNGKFHEYSILFTDYADWKFASISEKPKAPDWNVRPPCGLLYKTEFKELFDEIRNAKFGNRSKKPSPEKVKEERTHNLERQNNEAYINKDTHRPRNQKINAKHSERGKRPAKSLNNNNELLKSALEECNKAIEQLKKNPNIHEIPLSAQNSFIRQKQHAHITAEGFCSDSRGEGSNRHVCIMPK